MRFRDISVVVVVVLLSAIYGFNINLPTPDGHIEINSGFKVNAES